MDREVRISDMVAYEMEFGTPAREKFWRTRMNAGDVGTRSTETGGALSSSSGAGSSSTTATAPESSGSDGGTGSGGGSVTDIMRELREAQARVMELGDHNAIIDRRLSRAYSEIATLTRQLGEEREQVDQYRKSHRSGFGCNIGMMRSVGALTEVDARCDTCKAHDARREREKQNNVGETDGLASESVGNPPTPTVSPPSSSTTDPSATVTDDDRSNARVYLGGIGEYDGSAQRWTDHASRLATLLARIRHQRDGEIRELVTHIQMIVPCVEYWGGYELWANNAKALIAKHGGGK